MALGRLHDRQNDLNRCPTPSSVVDASMAFTDCAPERVKSVSLAGPTWTARDGDLARPVNAVNENAARRKSQVATLASRNNQSEVRQIGLLGWKHPSTEAESLVSFDVAWSR
jgi:hypothetical protein